MVYFSTVVSLLAAAAATAPALAISLSSSTSAVNLLRRALDPSTFPTQCQPTCTPIIDTINSCSLPSCICTTTNGKDLLACVECLVQVDPIATIISDAQNILTYFDGECPNITPLSLSTGAATAIPTSTSISFATATVPKTSASATSSLNPFQKSSAVAAAIVRSRSWIVTGWVVGVVVAIGLWI